MTWEGNLGQIEEDFMINKTRLTTSGVLLSVFLLPLMLQDVHAYIDAGTGSLIIQILIAGFVGGLFLENSRSRKGDCFLCRTRGLLPLL